MKQVAPPIPLALFDTLENIHHHPTCVMQYITTLTVPAAQKELEICTEFLKSYVRSRDTFTAYRREVERLLHWAWLVNKKSLREITRNDIRDYLTFVQSPPKSWIATKMTNRFILQYDGERQHNPTWRPFVVKITKMARRHGKEPDKAQYQLGNKSMEAIFAILSSLFTYLQQEEYLEVNPIALVRQKKDIFNGSKRVKLQGG